MVIPTLPLESATYISSLNPAYPAATDPLEQGDDHLRLIKSTILATFPNITGPITATQAAINAPFLMPVGSIIMWSSAVGSVPTGWATCDGSIVPRVDGSGNIVTPDLRDRFVVGAGPLSGASGAMGGASSATATSTSAGGAAIGGSTGAAGAFTPTVSVTPTALTVAQLPAHHHNTGIADDYPSGLAVYGSVSGSGSASVGVSSNSGIGGQTLTSDTGNGDTHTHAATASAAPDHTHTFAGSVPAHTHSVTTPTVPPYFALLFIMKL